MQQFLFHNNRDGTFSERALEAGVAFTDDGSPYAGMGVDFRDYDNDGRPDLIVTNLAKQIYAVYHNEGNGSFTYKSLETGMGTLSAASSGWGVRFEDFDNDGRKDLFIAQGHVLDNVDRIDPSKHYRELPLLAMNRGERFERADTGVSSAVAGRGLAIGDLNNDGSTDAVIGVLGDHPLVSSTREIARTGSRSLYGGRGVIEMAQERSFMPTGRPTTPARQAVTCQPAISAYILAWAAQPPRRSRLFGLQEPGSCSRMLR